MNRDILSTLSADVHDKPEEAIAAASPSLRDLHDAIVDLQKRMLRLEGRRPDTEGRLLMQAVTADQAQKQIFPSGR